jgi:hypothetical protein
LSNASSLSTYATAAKKTAGMTYDDFAKYGIRRKSIPFGIRAAVALGWIDIVELGHRGAPDLRRAARYALTWVDRHDGAPRTIATEQSASDKSGDQDFSRLSE